MGSRMQTKVDLLSRGVTSNAGNTQELHPGKTPAGMPFPEAPAPWKWPTWWHSIPQHNIQGYLQGHLQGYQQSCPAMVQALRPDMVSAPVAVVLGLIDRHRGNYGQPQVKQCPHSNSHQCVPRIRTLRAGLGTLGLGLLRPSPLLVLPLRE